MAEAKNHFLSGKMNKDIEDRLLKDSEYRDALNITVGKAGENNVGSIENVKSNVLAYSVSLGYTDAQPIGYVVDEKNDFIYWFVTTFAFQTGVKEYPTTNDYCAILKYDQKNSIFSTVLEKRFLRFCKKHLITGVNLVDNYLFWTDNFNQPRRLDLNISPNLYNYDEQLSIPRCVPYKEPTVLIRNNAGTIVNSMQYDQNVVSNFLKERFVRFSYRFKFIDNSYSPIAPFTQILFIPKEFFETSDIVSTYKTTENVCMVNTINRIISKIELPSHNMYEDYFVKGIDILLKESDSTIIRSIEYIDIKDYNDSTSTRYNDAGVKVNNFGNGNIFYHEYKSNTPSKTLPESQYLRVWDRVPRLAKAQEIAGSRVVYGNYLENYRLPELDYFITYGDKVDWLEYPNHSVKQNRNYQIGIVLTDIVGRSSSVIITKNAPDSYVFVEYLSDAKPNVAGKPWHGLEMQINFRSPIPNPYSVKTQIGVSRFTRATTEIYNSSTKLYDYVFNFNVSSELSVGDWLLGENGNHVRIFAVNGSTISTEGKINEIYKPVSSFRSQPIYKYKINKNGWHSYKVVVKQKEQDYYNVYTPGVVNYKDRSWITLHSDNINKVPRDLTMTGRQDGTYASSTILYAKVVKNRFPNIGFTNSQHNQKGSVQYEYTVFPISVVSIGTASDQKIQITTGTAPNTVTTNANWLYEYDKDHLLAEVEDNADLDGETLLGLYVDFNPQGSTTPAPVARTAKLIEFNNKIDGTTPYTIDQAELHLNVFETKPVQSLLDIFWETSTNGLVEDLNENIIVNSDEGPSGDPNLPGDITVTDPINNQPKDYFYESWPTGTIICNITAQENGYPITSYDLIRVYNELPAAGELDWSQLFEINNVTGYATIKLKVTGSDDKNHYFENDSINPQNGNIPAAFRNVFNFVIRINTDAGSVEKSFVMKLRNSPPYFSHIDYTDDAIDGGSNYYFPSGLFFNVRDFLTYTENGDRINNNKTPFYWYIVGGNGNYTNNSPLPVDAYSDTGPIYNANDDLVHTIYKITRFDQYGDVITNYNGTQEFDIVGGGVISGLRPIGNLVINDRVNALIAPKRVTTYHIIIETKDCNAVTGSLSTQLNGASIGINGVANKLTHMHEIFIDVGTRDSIYGEDQRKLNKYELTHCPLIPYLDNRLQQFLRRKCYENAGNNAKFSTRNTPLGDVYKLIDEKWYKCTYYFFRNSMSPGSGDGSSFGSPHIQFYLQAVQPATGYSPPAKLGNVITSMPYGTPECWGPSGTLTTPPGKELRTLVVGSVGPGQSWYNSWRTKTSARKRMADWNVFMKIVVEWDIVANDITKVYLLADPNQTNQQR